MVHSLTWLSFLVSIFTFIIVPFHFSPLFYSIHVLEKPDPLPYRMSHIFGLTNCFHVALFNLCLCPHISCKLIVRSRGLINLQFIIITIIIFWQEDFIGGALYFVLHSFRRDICLTDPVLVLSRLIRRFSSSFVKFPIHFLLNGFCNYLPRSGAMEFF